MAFILPPYVASGAPIASAWGNQVVDALSNHESRQHSSAWVNLSITGGSWTVPSGYYTPACRLDPAGENVEIRGALTKQTAAFSGSVVLCTLPGGYRPAAGTCTYAVLTTVSTSQGYQFIRANIASSGSFTLVTGGMTLPADQSIWLDGIRFSTT